MIEGKRVDMIIHLDEKKSNYKYSREKTLRCDLDINFEHLIEGINVILRNLPELIKQ